MSQYAPASVDTTGTQDINIPEIKNELNRHIDLILRHHFLYGLIMCLKTGIKIMP